MPTTIQDLYYGNITPADQIMSADSPLRKLTTQLAKYEAGLTGLLDAEDAPLLKALVETRQQIDSITAEENFMKNYSISPTDENAAKLLQEDQIGRNNHIKRFLQLLDAIEENCSIALNGEWGSGKSIFVRQIKLLLDYA